MRKYRIAFFTVDWNYELVESTLHGLKRFTDDHENVSIQVFDCFGKDLDTPRNRSEFAVFRLADLSRYDGALIQGNQLIFEPARLELMNRILETGIPAVSIGCPMEGCTLVRTDDRKAQYDITAHLIRGHGAKRLVYLTGILDNGCPEAEYRRDGFLDACRDFGIEPRSVTVIPGTWRTEDGSNAVKSFLKDDLPLPDAFVCANDEMALGVIDALSAAGVRVPEDVMVTGYDNIMSARLSNPPLSTVAIDSNKQYYFGMQVLIDRIDGTETREEVIFPYELILSESCGCKEAEGRDQARIEFFQQTQLLKRFYLMQDQLAEELFGAPDLLELMNAVEQNRKIFGCDSVYLCMNDYYYDSYDRDNWQENSEDFGKNMVMAACGVSMKSGNRRYRGERFETGKLLPPSLMEKERFLIFYPLHYTTYSIGYVAMNSISVAAKLNLHESILNFLEIAIDNVRKKMLLRQLNDVLDDLYVHDGLTKLFNRFGYERYAEEIYRQFLDETGSVQILFIDMDGLKAINDRLGHEAGDEAIQLSAKTLKKVCGERDFLMRYGGDEFLIIADGRESCLAERIEEELARCRCTSDPDIQLGMSIGSAAASAEDQRSLESCVQEADQMMYEIKRKRKKSR